MPKRIQLQRTKGWRIPPNTVVVSRPSKFGNPIKVGAWLNGHKLTRGEAVAWYREHVTADSAMGQDAIHELRGKDLACWCPVTDHHGNYVPCHADVLLEIANL